LRPGRPGFEAGIDLMLNAPNGKPGQQKDEGGDGSQLNDAGPQVGPASRATCEIPHPGQHCGRYAKGNHVGQRIEFASEALAVLVRRAIPPSKNRRRWQIQCLGRLIEVPGSLAVPWMACDMA